METPLWKDLTRHKRAIIVIGSKVYPCDGVNIQTKPEIPFEDYMLGRFDKDSVIVSHSIKSRGRVVPVLGLNPRVEFRRSGRMVCYYDA